MSIQANIRVRPIPQGRESPMCVEATSNSITIKYEDNQPRTFNFDNVFWSADGFKNEDGLLVKESERYADQQAIFEVLSPRLIDSALEGTSSCLIVYGQTGSGKSFTLTGDQHNKGILSLVLDGLFSRASSDNEITMSAVEIYNEQIRDLIVHPSQQRAGRLRIKETRYEVYVDGLSDVIVNNLEQAYNIFETILNNRTIGATLMNSTSSRAHTVFYICLPNSQITLVDLAGSERAASSTGRQLREGASINKSLSTLGNVIRALAEVTSGKKKGGIVPYRESKLTYLIRRELSFNFRTSIIGTIYPNTNNFEESLSTLRYMDLIKRVTIKFVNVEEEKEIQPSERTPNQVQITNEPGRLEDINEDIELDKNVNGDLYVNEPMHDIIPPSKITKKPCKRKDNMPSKKRQNFDQVQKYQNKMMMKVSYNNVTEIEEPPQPHIENLNADPMISGQVKFNVTTLGIKVGRDSNCDVPLKGTGIAENHCSLQMKGNQFFITPQPSTNTYVNGNHILEPTEIKHQDRIRFGINSFFIFINTKISNTPEYTFEFAEKEALLVEQNILLSQKQAENDLMVAEINSKNDSERAKIDEFVRKCLGIANEANSLAASLGKKIRFETEYYIRQDTTLTIDNFGIRFRLMLSGLSEHSKLYWDIEYLEERIPDMYFMYEQYTEGTPIDDILFTTDPFEVDLNFLPGFVDPCGYVGKVPINLEPLINLVSQPDEPLAIIDTSGQEIGKLVVGLSIDIVGENLKNIQMNDLNDAIGKHIKLTISIKDVLGLHEMFCNEVFCSFNVPGVRMEIYQTKKLTGSPLNFDYSYTYAFVATKRTISDLDKLFNIHIYCAKPKNVRKEEIKALKYELKNIISDEKQKENHIKPTNFTPVDIERRTISAAIEGDKDQIIRELQEINKKQQEELRILKDRLNSRSSSCCSIF